MIKKNKLYELLSLIVVIYLFLFCINFFFQKKHNEYISERISKIENLDIDRRHQYLVLKEMNLIEPTVQAQHPVIYLYRADDYKKDFFPLSGYSSSKTLMCNENGYWKSTRTDKYGFNNTEENYQKAAINDNNILIIGDSSSEGYCVKDNYLPKYHLENLGYNVINLSKGGNGPIIEYASLKEYIEIANFKTVIWMYYPNDLNDLLIESQDSVLMKYLNSNFHQNIINKQNLVDNFYRDKSDGFNQYVNFINEADISKLDKKFEELEKLDYFTKKLNLSTFNIIDYFFLKSLILDIKSRVKFLKMKNDIKVTYPILKQTLLKAKTTIDKNNAKMLFVYLPSRIDILSQSKIDTNVVNILNDLEIDYLDLNEKIVGNFKYEEAYSYGLDDVHYNEKVYEVISKEISKLF